MTAPTRVPAARQPAAPAHRRCLRVGAGRALGGVAAGVADHLGLSPLVVRLAFVVLTFASGAGVLLYAALWLLLPQADDGGPGHPPARARESRVQLLALGAVGVGGLLLLDTLGLFSPTVLPLLAAAGGLALVWQQADSAQRARWRRTAGGRPGGLLAAGLGAALLAFGLLGFLAARGELQAAVDGLLATVVVVVGLALLLGPWLLRMTTDLREERLERIRSQERAEVAAHVHDSVLQTLALIRKAADDPREVQRLARSQERELRGWLYAPPAGSDRTLRAALEQLAGEVEEAHGVAVETVVVGDCPTTPALQALVAATREALTNAAVHAGVPTVSLYAEVAPERVEVFVRDRGCGFELAAVPADRYGVRQSVLGRMERNGGRAEVVSRPGKGTEVRLEVARD
jgi:signal transduction histidine kinase